MCLQDHVDMRANEQTPKEFYSPVQNISVDSWSMMALDET